MSRGLAVAALLALAGCGTEHHVHAAGGAAGAYRWLVPLTGAAPSIAAENAHPGSSAWRAGDRDTRRSGIDVYVSAQDLRPGAQERVFVRARGARSVGVRLFRIGWYGGAGARLVLESSPLAVRAQPRCPHDARTGLTECRWHPTLSFVVPPALPSGVYVVNLIAGRGRQRDAMFVLEGQRPAPLVAQLSTATYEAYNDWGGDSLYPGGRRVGATGTGQGVAVSYDRPYATLTGAGELFARDAAMVRFLERQALPVSYVTSTAVDQDPHAVSGARALIDIGHSEYWSQRARERFTAARDHGTGLAFISSDTLAWRVRFAPSAAGEPAHRIVGYKEFAARDPQRATGAFRDGGAPLTGSAYVGCITPRRPAKGRAAYHYYDWSPAPAAAPSWLYSGSGLTARSRVRLITGYELDRRTGRSPAGIRIVGSGSAPCQKGSGVAQTTLYRARSGALVFATGTLGWVFGLAPLADPGADVRRPADPGLVRVTLNVLRTMLGGAR